MTTATTEKPAKQPMNGVDVPTLIATIGVVGRTPSSPTSSSAPTASGSVAPTAA